MRAGVCPLGVRRGVVGCVCSGRGLGLRPRARGAGRLDCLAAERDILLGCGLVVMVRPVGAGSGVRILSGACAFRFPALDGGRMVSRSCVGWWGVGLQFLMYIFFSV